MPIDFPNSPTTNQVYTVNGRTWIYDGEKWGLQGVSNSMVLDGLSDVTAPSPTVGDLLEWNGSAWVNDSNATLAGLTVAGATNVEEIREKVVDSSITSNVMTCNYSTGGVFYQATAPSANFTVNITNLPIDNGNAITISIFVAQGATQGIPSAVQVAGAAQTLKWAGGSTPTASASGKIDVFTFTLIRRSSAWTVLGSANLNY